jgi:hypothetical protein
MKRVDQLPAVQEEKKVWQTPLVVVAGNVKELVGLIPIGSPPLPDDDDDY